MANNFSVVGAPTFSTGKFGNALTPSSGKYLTHTNASVFRSSTGLTVEYWFKTSSTTLDTAFGRANGEWFGIFNGHLYSPSAGIGEITGVTINDNQWHHVAWCSTGSASTVYLDGNQVKSTAFGINTAFWPSTGQSSAIMFIGCRSDNSDGSSPSGFFNGQIDDLRISSTVRYTANFTVPANTPTGDSATMGLYRLEADGTDSSGDLTPPPGSPIPGPPTGIVATPSTGQVALTWTAGTDDVGVVSYRIYRRGVQVGTSTTTSFTETRLPGGVLYEYRLTSIDGDGNESVQSSLATATTPLALKAGAPPIIFDSDMSSDIDDMGALATLHALADLGECQIIGMMVSSQNGGTAEAMDAVNTYYGRPNIPIGVRPDVGGRGGYPGTVAGEFPHDLSYTSAPLAATLYRQLLAAASNGSVVIVSTGFLTNLSALLSTAADGVSSLTGSQLVAQKVKLWACMGGGYPNGGEFNFTVDSAAAFAVVNNWPTAATFSGFEIGSPIYTGGPSLFASTPATNPVRRAWEVYSDPSSRPSFDQAAAYLSCRFAEGLWGTNSTGRNNTNSDGTNFWTATPDPSGATEQQYLLERVRHPLQQAIDTLICATPGAVAPGAPPQPTYLRATSVTSTSITLAWTSNSYNESGFAIERRDNTTGNFAQIGTVGAGVTTYTDSGLTSTANRAYRVYATSARGNSAYATLSVFSGWTETNLATPANTPLYTVVQNHLRYQRAVPEDHITVNNDSTHGTTVTVTTDVGTTGAGGSSCIYFLYQDTNNWYRLNVTDTASKFEKRVAGGTVTQLGSTGAGISIGNGTKLQTWQVALTPSGMTFTSPSVTLTATDTFSFSTGKIAFGGLARGPLWQNITLAGTAAQAPTSALSNTALPVISGTAQTGQTVSVSTGTWSATPDSYTYQWNRGGTPISGATTAPYVVVSADVGQLLTATVTASKAGYTSGSATSAAVTPTSGGGGSTPPALSNTSPPTISGLAQTGQLLTAGVGSWNVTPDSFTYQWLRNGTTLVGATSVTYLLTSADLTAVLAVTGTASKAGYTAASATSAATAAVTDPPIASGLQLFVNKSGVAAPVSADGISPSTLAAKGDLLGATASGTPARVPVGADGQVLKADSTTPTGVAWGTSSGGASSAGAVWPATVYADNPPAGLAAVTFQGATVNDAPALQAQLNYVKSTFGGGRVVVSRPGAIGNGGAAVRLGTGLTIPAKVQLVSDETTLFDASPITSGPAITVNDTNFTPLVGVRMDGGMFSPTSANLTSGYIGIAVTGSGLKFHRCHLQYFGRAVDVAQSNTYGCSFEDFTIDHCATGLYADLEASGAVNSGEKIVYSGGSIANSVRGFRATSGGMHIRFIDTSIDFCTELGSVNNARVFIQGHLESGGDGVNNYLFDVTGNSMVDIVDTEIVMGGRTGGLYYIFRQTAGPSNYAFGSARFNNVHCFFTDSDGVAQNVRSEQMVDWPASTTTKTISTPYPLRWNTTTAQFCVSDGGGLPNDDRVYVSASNTSTGKITLTAPSNANFRWVLVRY